MGFMPNGDTNMEKDIENMNEMGADARIYEVGYLLVPTLSEEEVPGVYTNLKDLISSLGTEIISDDMPKMMNLAYTMTKVIANVPNKFDNGYFGWVKFAMDPEKVDELKKKLDLDPNYIRFLILKTVRENTIAGRRFVGGMKRRTPSTTKEGEEVVMPINKEEIDKEIDAMVSV
jgi:ribosomal protein S6